MRGQAISGPTVVTSWLAGGGATIGAGGLFGGGSIVAFLAPTRGRAAFPSWS
jgi:hypothetical protein